MERTEMLENEEEDYERRGLFEKIKAMFAHGDEYEEDDLDAPVSRTTGRQAPVLRTDHGRGNAIFTKLVFRGMQDAQSAADRLKERRSVIVNFERTDEDIARRGIDFISGVTYALDGFYEKVGEKVFLFTPNNTAIVPDDPDTERTAGYGAYNEGR